MPGEPVPAVGGEATTAVLAALAALVAVGGPAALVRLRPGWRSVVAGALVYGTVLVGLWAGVRGGTGRFAASGASTVSLATWILFCVAVLAVHAGIALYAVDRRGLVGPLAVLFAAGVVAAFVFLHVQGESDPIWVYLVLFGPLTVLGQVLAAVLELGGRRLFAAVDGPA